MDTKARIGNKHCLYVVLEIANIMPTRQVSQSADVEHVIFDF